MESDGRVVVSETRSGFFVGWREFFLLLVILVLAYYFYLYLRDRGYDLSTLPYPTMRVNATNVNLRTGPGMSNPIIRRLPKGSRIVYLNEYRNIDGEIWAKVRGNGSDGWINRTYVD